jgi:hypothetical protein
VIEDRLRRKAKESIILQRLVRWYRARTGYPDWNKIFSRDRKVWEEALGKSKGGPKILVATSIGSHLPGTTLESLLGVALTLRGAEVHFLLCDTYLPACLESRVTWYRDAESFIEDGPKRVLCRDCFSPADAMYGALGLPVYRYSELVTSEESQSADRISSGIPFEEIGPFQLDGAAVGEHALAGTLRFFARATLDEETHAEGVLRRYFKAALLATFASRNLLRKLCFEAVVFHHGIYVPQGLIGEVARREKVRVVNWNPAYRKKCFIFSHGDTYHHTLMSEPAETWESMTWTPQIEADLMKYLKSRWQGTEDWIWFHESPDADLSLVESELDFSKPCIGMLTNVMWDAQLHYPANAFPNMLEWVLKTIDYFSKRPELQLLIRVHPAETRGSIPSRQPLIDEVKKAFPVLPKNVLMIPPDDRLSTYAAMSKCDAVIIYGTKTGVELTSMGIPVIVAGEAWIRNKGLTLDATSADDYFNLLDRLPLGKRLDGKTIERARKYAYHFFFRRMIPLEFMQPAKGWPPYRLNLSGIKPLQNGGDPGLEVICRGILNGADFVYPSEEFATLPLGKK